MSADAEALRLAREALTVLSGYPLEEFGLGRAHDGVFLTGANDWRISVGDIRKARAALAALAALPPQAEPAELAAIHAERRWLLQNTNPTAEDERRFNILTERMRELQPAVTPEQWMALGRIQGELKAIEGRRADRESLLMDAERLCAGEQVRGEG